MGMTLKELLTKGEGTLSAQEAKALAAQCRMDLDTLYTLLEERGIKIQEEEIEPSLDVEGIMAEVESAENNNDDLGIGADEDEDQSEENPADLKAAMDELLDDPVKNYLKQIGQIPLLSAEQEVELSRRIHAGAEAAHILQADRQKYGAPEYIKKNSARFSFEEDENSRSYTEDLDDDGNEKSSEDAEEKAAEEEAMEAVENGPLTEEKRQELQVDVDDAEYAKKAAEDAQKAAEEAKAAAELALEAAKKSEVEAAASAAEAAEYARQMAETYQKVVEIKAELIDYLAEAQAAAEKAEAERKAAEEARKAAEEAALAASKYAASFELAQLLHESETLTGHAREDYAKVIEDAKAAIEAAKTPEEVDEILAAAREALKTAGCPSTNFTDVEENGWYHTGVDFMVRNGFMNGVADDAFDVDGNLTRAQLVTILYRIAGEPESTATNPFADVADGQWYTNAVIWAAENGIVKGVNTTTFAPNDQITREQIATILFRYAKAEKVEGKLAGFPDAEKISDYAADAMAWAVEQGLINGISESDGKTYLAPQETATRAQIAVILMRYLTAEN